MNIYNTDLQKNEGVLDSNKYLHYQENYVVDQYILDREYYVHLLYLAK